MSDALANFILPANAWVMDVADYRRDYDNGELRRADLAPDPFVQFAQWFEQAAACPAMVEANAMTLATSGSGGQVTARTVLLKAWDQNGFVFFTNYQGKKAMQIAENSQVALLFAWLPLERQISISGTVEKVSREESRAYFSTRPFASQIGAWVSQQSAVIPSREFLEEKAEELRRKFGEGEIPLPEFWGGYRVVPQCLEFWQGRRSRLHDRFLYTRADGPAWTIDRLSP